MRWPKADGRLVEALRAERIDGLVREGGAVLAAVEDGDGRRLRECRNVARRSSSDGRHGIRTRSACLAAISAVCWAWGAVSIRTSVALCAWAVSSVASRS